MNIYIGKNYKIDVYDGGGELISTIENLYMNYNFTLLHNDTILISTSNSIIIMDTSGKIISEETQEDYSIRLELNKNKNKYEDKNGKIYRMKHIFGYYSIVRLDDETETTIYSMPKLDYFILLLSIMTYGSLIVFVPTILYIKWKEEKHFRS